MEDMAATLKAMRKKSLLPQTYNSREEVEDACRAGRIFVCKTNVGILILSIIVFFVGIGLVLEVIFFLFIGYLSLNIIGIGNAAIGLVSGVIAIVFGAKLLEFYRKNFFLIGPYGILFNQTRFSLPWDQILNVEWQEKSKNGNKFTHIKFTTVGGLQDRIIVKHLFSPIDTLPRSGIEGLFEVIYVYFQWSRSLRPAAPKD